MAKEYKFTQKKEQIQALINSIPQKADKSELAQLSLKQSKDDDSWGHYSDRQPIILTPVAGGDGYAIDKSGTKVAKAGWAIAEFTAVKGNTYLFKPGTMDGNVCIFAEKIETQEARNTDYQYTYNDEGLPITATATYNGATHSYAITYDSEGKETITDTSTGTVVEALPLTYTTVVGTYDPMTNLNANAELPMDGYCRFVSHFRSDTDLVVTVSYNKADADLVMKVVRDGNTASICTQLSKISKRVGQVTERVEEALIGIDTLLSAI